ncbi:MAG: glycerol-3-phosphate 1-O-acyltransferase PlsY [Sulfobacillus thermotolerans]|uniref:Glycerol-3-phosphate acyltransferase n=1 Tax=Sulfobacillus thermotolerans TaxID=338644 RepID=A0ABM6RRD7_9FIRM|nr:acyl-phosphate glycerol 3-phosphate acyltransferase [Sulfobacillus thermotolerans]MCY0909151.1 glycerol-3-phosphate 1-O-acyltransferase PlsY [Sulfobacillus thermotolerans]
MGALAIGIVIVAFFLGAIPFGYLLARLRFQTDIRQHGSQNIGATNVARTFGLSIGLIVLGLDALKGILAVQLAYWVTPAHPAWAALAGFFAVLGHVFSPFMRFKGGKGIACGLGVVISLFWPAALGAALVFAGVVLIFRIVSVASLMGMIAALVTLWAAGRFVDLWYFAVPTVILALWAHRKNWERLIQGKEPRFGR